MTKKFLCQGLFGLQFGAQMVSPMWQLSPFGECLGHNLTFWWVVRKGQQLQYTPLAGQMGRQMDPRSKIPFLKKGILLRGVNVEPLGLHFATSGVPFACSQAVLEVAWNIFWALGSLFGRSRAPNLSVRACLVFGTPECCQADLVSSCPSQWSPQRRNSHPKSSRAKLYTQTPDPPPYRGGC